MSPSKNLTRVTALIVAASILAPAAATATPIDPSPPGVNAVAAQSQVPSNLPLGVLRATGGVNGAVGTGALEGPAAQATDLSTTRIAASIGAMPRSARRSCSR